jgi:hypothetical protein
MCSTVVEAAMLLKAEDRTHLNAFDTTPTLLCISNTRHRRSNQTSYITSLHITLVDQASFTLSVGVWKTVRIEYCSGSRVGRKDLGIAVK